MKILCFVIFSRASVCGADEKQNKGQLCVYTGLIKSRRDKGVVCIKVC